MKYEDYARRSGRAMSEAGRSATPPPLDQASQLRRRQALLILTLVVVAIFGVIAFFDSPSADGPVAADSTVAGTTATTDHDSRQLYPPTTFYPSAPPGVLIDPPCIDMGDCAFGFVLGQGDFYEVTCTPAKESSLPSEVLAQGSLASVAVTVKEMSGVSPRLMVAIDKQGAGRCSSGSGADWMLAYGPGRYDDETAFSAAICEVGQLSDTESVSYGCSDAVDLPGDVRTVEILGGAMRLTYPADWYLAEDNLTPNLGDPREVFSLGSFPLTPGGPNCAQIPSRALHDLGATDVFVTVQERTAADPAGFDPRPEQFGPTPGDTDNVFYDCIDPTELDDIGTLHWIWFTDQNRYFHMLVALGADASAEKVSALWNSLDQLEIEPPASRTPDAAFLVEEFLASRVAGVGAESYLTPLGQQAFGLSGTGAHELAGLLYDESGRNFTKGEVVLIDEMSASPTEPATWEIMVRLDVEQSDVGHRETLFVVSLSNGTFAVDGGRIGWEGP